VVTLKHVIIEFINIIKMNVNDNKCNDQKSERKNKIDQTSQFHLVVFFPSKVKLFSIVDFPTAWRACNV